MTFGCQNIKTTSGKNLRLFIRYRSFDFRVQRFRIGVRLLSKRFHDLHIDIAAKLNISPATRHICSKRYRAKTTGLCDDLRFLLVLARI